MPELDKAFEKLVDHLVAHEKDTADAVFKQSDPKPWCNFSKSATKGGPDPETPTTKKEETELHETLKRDKPNEKYVEARNEREAKANDIALPKLAGDFLAACERDKRMQWRSRIRMIAHAMARTAGNGQDNGPLRRHTVDYLSRIYMKAEEKEAVIS